MSWEPSEMVSPTSSRFPSIIPRPLVAATAAEFSIRRFPAAILAVPVGFKPRISPALRVRFARPEREPKLPLPCKSMEE